MRDWHRESTAPSAGGVVLLRAFVERVHWVHPVPPSLLCSALSTTPKHPRSTDAPDYTVLRRKDTFEWNLLKNVTDAQIHTVNGLNGFLQEMLPLKGVCFLQEMVDWFNAIRAARFHYLQVAFPGASDEEVRTV